MNQRASQGTERQKVRDHLLLGSPIGQAKEDEMTFDYSNIKHSITVQLHQSSPSAVCLFGGWCRICGATGARLILGIALPTFSHTTCVQHAIARKA
jgi:hypothetical protein